jgi:hypothetical protein
MTQSKKMWKAKCITWEEAGTDSEDSMVDGLNDEDSDSNADTGANKQSSKEVLEVNMVFTIPLEFRTPESEVAKLDASDERAVFEKPV